MDQNSHKTPTSQSPDRPLEGIIAFADVRSKHANHSEAVLDELRKLGAKVTSKFLPNVTHVIFKDGSKNTEKKAKKYGSFLLNAHWLESCKERSTRVCEKMFLIGSGGESSTKKKQKSMMPKDFSQEVRDASDRIENRHKKRRSGIEMPAPLPNIAADRVNLHSYITCPRTPPAMQKRIDELRYKNSTAATPLSPLVNSASVNRFTEQDNARTSIDLGDSPELSRPKSSLQYQRQLNIGAANSYWRAAAGLDRNPDLNKKLQVTQPNQVPVKGSPLLFSPTSPPHTDYEDTSIPLCINSSMLEKPIRVPNLSPDKPIKSSYTNQLDIQPINASVTSKLNSTANRIADSFNRPITPSDSTPDVSAFHHSNTTHSQVIPETPDSLSDSSSLQLLTSNLVKTADHTNRESYLQLVSDSDNSAASSLTKPSVILTKRRSLGTRRRQSAIVIPNSEPHINNNNTTCNNRTNYSTVHASDTAITGDGTPGDFLPNSSVLLTSPIKLLELSSASECISQETLNKSSDTKTIPETELSQEKKSDPKRQRLRVPAKKDDPLHESQPNAKHESQPNAKEQSSTDSTVNISNRLFQPLEPIKSRKLYQWNISSPLELRDSSCDSPPEGSSSENGRVHPSVTVMSQISSKIKELRRSPSGKAAHATRRRTLKPARQCTQNLAGVEASADRKTFKNSHDYHQNHEASSKTKHIVQIHAIEDNAKQSCSESSGQTAKLTLSRPEDKQDNQAEKYTKRLKRNLLSAVKPSGQIEIFEDETSKTVPLSPVTRGPGSQSQTQTGDVLDILMSPRLRDGNRQQISNGHHIEKKILSESTNKRKISFSESSPPIRKQKRTEGNKSKQAKEQRSDNDPPSNTVSPDRYPVNSSSENTRPQEDIKTKPKRRKKIQSQPNDENEYKKTTVPQAKSTSTSSIRARPSTSLSSTCSSTSNSGSFNKRTMALTSLHSNDRSFVRSVVKQLGDYKIKSEPNRSTHVVICGDNRRTLNVLRAISYQTILLNLDWVTDSYEAGKWLDFTNDKYWMISAFPGAKLAYFNNDTNNHRKSSISGGLFGSVGNIYISPLTNPPQNDLHELVKLNAGQVTTSLRNCAMQIGRSFNDSNKVPIVKESWILDSITHQRLLDHKFYNLTPTNMNSSNSDSDVFE